MSAITPDTTNEMFQWAIQLVNQSSRNIFLTGKAGTGKTTFLKYIRENCLKQMAVVAPTGVAAINAGGVTIHSFFQLPFAPFVPATGGFTGNTEELVNKNSLLSRLRLTGEKKKVLRQLELLVIDEISMVRCDTLDAIDTILRHVRRRPLERFGGLQVLFIGDMLQLPPVIREQEWAFLSDYYESPFFFDSKVIREELPLYIEFNKIYRQSEERFIGLLNQVRNNQLDDDGLAILESRYMPGFTSTKGDGYILLTTHNEKARQINLAELNRLEGNLLTFKSEIKGEFPDRAYPADETLELKKGAQVMFIKNDTADRGKRYFNGKIGMVTQVEIDKIWVQCEEEITGIEVQKEKWENIRYTLNKKNGSLEEEVLGSFMQYPLRLAWAITIHKSQGLTFEKAIIDAGAAFAPGQVYVALSRCTSLEGLVLQTRVRSSSLTSDPRIVEFSRQSASSNQLEEEFAIARKQYQQASLREIFDSSRLVHIAEEIIGYLLENKSSFNKEAITWTAELLGKLNRLKETAAKFQLQLQALFYPGESGSSQALTGRVQAAAVYFTGEFDSLLNFLKQSPVTTDSRNHAKEYNENLKEIAALASLKRHLLANTKDLLDPEALQQSRKSFSLPAFSVNAYAGTSQTKSDLLHPELYHQLRELRDEICSPNDLPIYMVAGSQTLMEMCRYLPQTTTDLKKISGFGEAKTKKYGQRFLDIILAYSEENNLASLVNEKKAPQREKRTGTQTKSAKPETKAETFRLFNDGMSLEAIARERKLTRSTIEGHLVHYVANGAIPLEKLLSPERISLLEPHLENFEGGAIAPLRLALGNEFSFGEIRLVLAWRSFKKQGITG